MFWSLDKQNMRLEPLDFSPEGPRVNFYGKNTAQGSKLMTFGRRPSF